MFSYQAYMDVFTAGPETRPGGRPARGPTRT